MPLPNDVTVAFDLLLVTATTTEFRALREAARQVSLTWEKRRGEVTDYRYLGELQGTRVAAFQLDAMGSFSIHGSAFTCHRALQETRATSIIGLGTAFGVDEHTQRIGDLLVADAVHLYDEGTVIDDGAGNYRYTYELSATATATKHRVERFRSIDPASMGWGEALDTPRVRVGRMLSGGARIESRAFRDDLVERVRPYASPVVGGEMEAAGIAAACAAVKSDWVVVKAISDFASAASRASIKRTRGLAADNAARFTLGTLMLPTTDS